VTTLGLSSFGIYLGRFQRWNSWDVLTKPLALVADLVGKGLNPLDHPRPAVATMLYFVFLLLAYLALVSFAAMPGDRPTPMGRRA
jgi:uncharacterized membrane protein